MLMYLKVLFLCLMLAPLSGCIDFVKYLERLQEQSVDDLDIRSVNFQPKFQFEAPQRENLTPEEQRLVGAPPPRQGEVVLDGVRYYSANGHVCQYFNSASSKVGAKPKSACWINNKWVLAVPVLNTEPVKP